MIKKDFVYIDNIIFDKLPVNELVLQLVFFIISGGELLPIKLEKIRDGWKLKDGKHRLAAYKLLGIKVILAKYYDKRGKK